MYFCWFKHISPAFANIMLGVVFIMWKLITEENPPKGRVIKTKIDDANGVRNEQELKWDGRLWWIPDGSMYVYYTPTHWWCWV